VATLAGIKGAVDFLRTWVATGVPPPTNDPAASPSTLSYAKLSLSFLKRNLLVVS
jgi:hypothetical protein